MVHSYEKHFIHFEGSNLLRNSTCTVLFLHFFWVSIFLYYFLYTLPIPSWLSWTCRAFHKEVLWVLLFFLNNQDSIAIIQMYRSVLFCFSIWRHYVLDLVSFYIPSCHIQRRQFTKEFHENRKLIQFQNFSSK